MYIFITIYSLHLYSTMLFSLMFLYNIDSGIKKNEFVRNYQQFTSIKKSLDLTYHKYELCLHKFKEVGSLHKEANIELEVLKKRFIEVLI